MYRPAILLTADSADYTDCFLRADASIRLQMLPTPNPSPRRREGSEVSGFPPVRRSPSLTSPLGEGRGVKLVAFLPSGAPHP